MADPPKRIGWISRHRPTKRQLEALERKYPGHTLIIDDKVFQGADEIVKRITEGKYDEIIIVAPLSVMRALLQRGIKPIWAEMKQVDCNSPDAEVHIASSNGERCYRFIAFRRLKRINLHFVSIDDEA